MNTEQFLEIKKRAGMDRESLAAFLGITEKAVDCYLTGQRQIPSRTSKQMRILEALLEGTQSLAKIVHTMMRVMDDAQFQSLSCAFQGKILNAYDNGVKSRNAISRQLERNGAKIPQIPFQFKAGES